MTTLVTPETLTDEMVRSLRAVVLTEPDAWEAAGLDVDDIAEFCDVALGGRPTGHPQYRSTVTALNDRNAARRHICDAINARAKDGAR